MYNISNLQKLYDWLDANQEQVKQHLDFSLYYYDKRNEEAEHPSEVLPFSQFDCNTTCCLAGFAASSGLFKIEGEAYFSKFASKNFIDPDAHWNAWMFLFSLAWPNDYDQMMLRIKYAIDNNACHPDYPELRENLLLTPPTN